MNTETEFKLPPVDALRVNDTALVEMQHTLTPEENATFNELIDEQRTGYEAHKTATHIEVNYTNTDAENIHIAHPIGNAALHNPMAVHSGGWRTEQR